MLAEGHQLDLLAHFVDLVSLEAVQVYEFHRDNLVEPLVVGGVDDAGGAEA